MSEASFSLFFSLSVEVSLTWDFLLAPSAATEIEGTFRVNGSNKRMRELQAIFETPPRVRVRLPSLTPSHSPIHTAHGPTLSPIFVNDTSSTASHSIGKRKITRRMTSRASSAVTSPICLCVGPPRARASFLSFPTVAVADVCAFLLTQEPVIPYDLYFPVRISRLLTRLHFLIRFALLAPLSPSIKISLVCLCTCAAIVPRRDRYAIPLWLLFLFVRVR